MLRAGFVFVRQREVWLKPKHRLRPDAGRHNKSNRRLMQGHENEQYRRDREVVAASAHQREEILNADELPVNIQCPHLQCAALLKLPSVRGLEV